MIGCNAFQIDFVEKKTKLALLKRLSKIQILIVYSYLQHRTQMNCRQLFTTILRTKASYFHRCYFFKTFRYFMFIEISLD